MLTILALSVAEAQDCEVQVTLVCDGVEVPAEPDGSYDLAPTCEPDPIEDTGGADTDTDTDPGTDTGMGETGFSYIPDYSPGPYDTANNVMALYGQSLCRGPSPAAPWWDDEDTGDTGAGAEPGIVGFRFEPGSNSGWLDGTFYGDGWGDLRGPETGILTDRWDPAVHVTKVCYGSTTIDQWLWDGNNNNPLPLLDRAVQRADQTVDGSMRGYPRSTCLILGTTEAHVGNDNRYDDIVEFHARLQARWADPGETHLLMVPITGGDPTVFDMPYLADIEAADRQAAADTPGIVVIETADIFAAHLKPDGRHLTPRGSYLLGQRCADTARAADLLTEP